MLKIARSAVARARWMLPEGRSLPDDLWQTRHGGLVVLIWFHTVGLVLFALLRGRPPLHSLVEVLPLAVAAAVAGSPTLHRTLRSAVAALGLVSSSALLVHIADGSIEAHFHFFVMVGLLSLYQQWFPFLLAVGFVVVHHGALGALMPQEVYGHPAAVKNPWAWATIHGAFVLAASVANLLSWRLNEHQALHDELTDLANRTLFIDRAEAVIGRGDGAVMAVLLLDIDGFKQVNGTHGREIGDEILLELSRRLGRLSRPEDTCSRLGGDEFAVLLTRVHGAADAVLVADRIHDQLRVPTEVEGRTVEISVSIGVAVGTADAQTTPGDLLRQADLALCAAKRSGATRVKLYEPSMQEALTAELHLDADIRRAVASDQFRLHYQPILNLADMSLEGFEALVRWEHPERGLLPPSEFIERVEETGLIVPIGAWVIDEALRQLAAWDALAPDQALRISVNVSARQLHDDQIVTVVGTALENSGLDPARVTLEITESNLMQRSWQHTARLHALRGLGIKLAIDDFGTGYSALSYLRRLPVDVVKIDKSFVDTMLSAPEDHAIADAVVTLARAVHLGTVAEGIESSDQLEALAALGCERGQGYLFSRPLAADMAAEFIAANRRVPSFHWSSDLDSSTA